MSACSGPGRPVVDDGHATARTRRLASGILGGFLGRSLTLIAPFIVMPAMLHYLGEANFGIWMTAVAITSMAMFSDLGIGNGLLTRLGHAFGKDDHAAIRSDVASAYAMLSLVALSLMTVCGVVLIGIESGVIPLNEQALPHGAVPIIAISLGAFFLGIPASVIQRVMYACQQVVLSNAWQVAGAAVSVALCLLAIHAALPAWQVIAAYSLPPVLMMAFAAALYFRKRPELRPGLGDVSFASARDLLSLGSRFLLLSVLTATALNVDNLIIASKAGAEAVTNYAVPVKLGSLLNLVITTLYLPLWTANGEALARGDYDWVRKSARRMGLYGAVAVGTCGLALVAFSDTIVWLWMGRSFEGQRLILALIAALSVAIAITSPFQMILNSVGATRPQIWMWAIFLAFTVAAKLVLVGPSTIWVVPLITFVGYAAIILPGIYISISRLARNWARK